MNGSLNLKKGVGGIGWVGPSVSYWQNLVQFFWETRLVGEVIHKNTENPPEI